MSENKQVTEEVLNEIRPLLEKAKVQLMHIKQSIFTSTVVFSLVHKITYDVPTASVDGVYLYINPDFFKGLTAPERVFLLAHEAWHVIYEHVLRAKDIPDVKFNLYNMAADHVINLMLIEKGYTMPSGGLADRKFSNMCTEQVYAQLLKDKPDSSSFQPDISPSNSLPNDPQTNQPMTQDDVNSHVNDMVVKAALANELAGKQHSEALGSQLLDRIKELVNPVVPWNVVFQDLMVDKLKNDYSFKKRNRRFSQSNIVMPALYSEGIKDFVIAVDVSYSISPEEFKAFLAESESAREMLKPEFTEVIQWHTKIADKTKVPLHDSITEIEFKETGGTNIYPLFEYLIENPPKVAVIFTDGEFTDWNKPELINFPVIWVIYNTYRQDDWFKPEFGEVVYYDPNIGA